MQTPLRLLLLALALQAVASPEETSKKSREPFELEFVASDVFRSGSLWLPLARRLVFEAHYFGGNETDTGFTGVSWTLAWKGLKLAPGAGVFFGTNEFTTTPAVSFRWEYEKKWFITQGLVVQNFRDTPVFAEDGEAEVEMHAGHEPAAFVRPTISDGNHVSVRWRRITIGGSWEHIAFREGNEWKGGGRLAVRVLPHISGILYVLVPGHTEWRGGILLHSRKE